MFKPAALVLLFFYLGFSSFAQTDLNATLSFDFNEHQLKEKNNKVRIKAVGVSLTADRFGNEKSAAYIFGAPSSYINLGTSDLLKPEQGTFSMWVNIQDKVRAGKGVADNPLLIIHNGPGEDFHKRCCGINIMCFGI